MATSVYDPKKKIICILTFRGWASASKSLLCFHMLNIFLSYAFKGGRFKTVTFHYRVYVILWDMTRSHIM